MTAGRASSFADAIAWEASFQVWLTRFRRGDLGLSRAIWCADGAPVAERRGLLAVRVRQAERWLAVEAREAKRRATLAARRG